MVIGLFLGSLVVALVAGYSGVDGSHRTRMLAALGLAILAAIVGMMPASLELRLALGGLLGALGVALAVGESGWQHRAIALALATAACAMPQVAPADPAWTTYLSTPVAMGLIMLISRAWIGQSGTEPVAAAPFIALLGVAGASLGSMSEIDTLSRVPAIVLGCASVSALVTSMLKTKFNDWIAMIFMVATVGIVSVRVAQEPGLATSWVLAVAVAFFGAWFLRSGEARPINTAVPAVVWISLATLGFSQLRGFGLTSIAVVAVAAVTLSGSSRLLLSAAPLAAIAFARVVRVALPDTTMAFDIGQHYALIGLLVGALIIGAASELSAGRVNRISLMLGGAGLVMLAPTASVYLGQRGTLGLLYGLLVGPVFIAIREGARLSALALSAMLAGGLVMLYPRLLEWMDLPRDERLRILGMMALVAAALLAVAGMQRSKPVPAEAA
ncbi:MAG: hypothetical protein JNM85_08460 [Chthonomonas sp.]|nr:hypothetical protein [Chthonomonas sp.]